MESLDALPPEVFLLVWEQLGPTAQHQFMCTCKTVRY
jgi:hypothetical protein